MTLASASDIDLLPHLLIFFVVKTKNELAFSSQTMSPIPLIIHLA